MPRRPARPPATPPAAPPATPEPPAAEATAELVAPPAPGADTVLDALASIVNSVVTGTPFEQGNTVARLVHEQEQRAELISSLLLTHDQERLVRFLRMRKKLEGDLEVALNTGILSNADKVAFLNYLNSESRQMENNVRAGSAGLKDVIGMLVKLDYSMSQGDGVLRQRLAATSPQAREVVRKLAYRIGRATRAERSEVPD